MMMKQPKSFFNYPLLKRVFSFVQPYRFMFIGNLVLAIVLAFFTQRGGLRVAQRFKRRRADGQRGLAAFGHLYTVVDTPRRAGASVARPGNHQVALLHIFLVDRLWRGH